VIGGSKLPLDHVPGPGAALSENSGAISERYGQRLRASTQRSSRLRLPDQEEAGGPHPSPRCSPCRRTRKRTTRRLASKPPSSPPVTRPRSDIVISSDRRYRAPSPSATSPAGRLSEAARPDRPDGAPRSRHRDRRGTNPGGDLPQLEAKAAEAGHRVIAARLGRPASTVRGWLRAFTARAEQSQCSSPRWGQPGDRSAAAVRGRAPVADAVAAVAAARACRGGHGGAVAAGRGCDVRAAAGPGLAAAGSQHELALGGDQVRPQSSVTAVSPPFSPSRLIMSGAERTASGRTAPSR
jgi:hypothetical protein